MKIVNLLLLLVFCSFVTIDHRAFAQVQSKFEKFSYESRPLKVAQAGNYGNRFRGRRTDSANLRVGQMAPDFSLPTKDGKYKVKLSSYRNKKPVVLIFGSYT